MKKDRQAMIIEVIQQKNIETQEELASELKHAGFDVTQATVSRDIRQMNLTKVALPDGRQKYAVLESPTTDMNEKFIRILSEGFVSMDMAQNILVIKTVAGMAMAVAAALDALHWNEMVGCIAGDDTIMCAIRSVEDTRAIMKKIRNIIAVYHSQK